MTSEAECIHALREAAERLGESPTKSQYEQLGLTPASATIQRVMGSWNEAKTAAGLTTDASTGSRVQPKPDSIDLPSDLAWEELTQDQRWHYKNREWNKQRTLNRRARHRAWVHDRKRASDGCIECGENDPACLDYHHREGVEKEMTICEMVTHGYSKARLLNEMSKCQILCANCHRKRHYEIPDNARNMDGNVGSDDE